MGFTSIVEYSIVLCGNVFSFVFTLPFPKEVFGSVYITSNAAHFLVHWYLCRVNYHSIAKQCDATRDHLKLVNMSRAPYNVTAKWECPIGQGINGKDEYVRSTTCALTPDGEVEWDPPFPQCEGAIAIRIRVTSGM